MFGKWFFDFFRPRQKPKFSIGEIVILAYEVRGMGAYMSIKNMRWVMPVGKEEKQWCYDGQVVVVEGVMLWPRGVVSELPEELIVGAIK